MREYIISVMAISIICFVAKELSSQSALEGHMGFICALCIFLVALAPFFSSIGSLGKIELDSIYAPEGDNDAYEKMFEEYINNAEIDLIRSEVRSFVAKEFSLDESEIKIYLKYDETADKRLTLITVNLLGNAVFADSNKIEDFVESKTGYSTVVIIGE